MAGPTRDESEPDFDAEWNDITRRLGELRPPPEPEEPRADEAEPAAPRPRPPGPRDFALDELDVTSDDEADEDSPGFEPAEPERLMAGNPTVVLGWVALLGGLALFVTCAVLWRGAPGAVWIASVAVSLTGAGILLWQLPSGREDRDDDGAVL